MTWVMQRPARLIDALKERLGDSYSARFLKRALEANSCRVNGRVERFASVRLDKGDAVEFRLQISEEAPCKVLYEHSDFLILDKPSGLVSSDEEVSRAAGQTLYLAHRLDKETTGALLAAKTPSAAKELQESFRTRLVEKDYIALADGVPRSAEGTICSRFVKKGVFQGQTIWGSSSSERGVQAETSWKLVKALDDASLIACRPHTGRTHQLRVHLAEMGHPILIDRQYAARFRSRRFAKRVLLHARKLAFIWNGERIAVEAPLPLDLCNF